MYQIASSVLSKPIIHVDSVYERISERFDGVLELLTPNSFVYGGVLRDLVAEMPLVGDLDILVSDVEASSLCHKLRRSRSWMDVNILSNLDRYTAGMNLKFKLKLHKYPINIIHEITTFRNKNGVKVQIISMPIDEIYNFIKTVDMVCCGISMDAHGVVYEVIKGAEADCVNKVLTINEKALKHDFNIDNLKERISKLVDRGWENKVNVRQVTSKVNKLRIIQNKKNNKESNKICSVAFNSILNRFDVTFNPVYYNDLITLFSGGSGTLSASDTKALGSVVFKAITKVNNTTTTATNTHIKMVALNHVVRMDKRGNILCLTITPKQQENNTIYYLDIKNPTVATYILEVTKAIEIALLAVLKPHI